MSDLVTTRVFIDGEKGITAAKLNDITASSAIQPSFYTGKPTGSTADPADVMLILKAGAYTQVPVSTLANSISTATIWSTRLRSFNAIGNPNFEVNQVTAPYTPLTNPANGVKIIDRWTVGRVCTAAVNAGHSGVANTVLPGTNFCLTNANLALTLTTAQASLAATDYYIIQQQIEGSMLRELISDVHSISLLVYSTVANLKFGVILRDVANTKSLSKLCTVPSANTWTLITLPNIPLWPGGTTWSTNAGNAGYNLMISLACGSTYMAPANDTWQGSFLGAVGMSNWLSSPVNSALYIAMVQHEPGAVCTTLMDKPFQQNLDECLRYYTKSYDYATAAGSSTGVGAQTFLALGAFAGSDGIVSFKKPMAKIPTAIIYNHATGAANSLQDGVGTNHPVVSLGSLNTNSFSRINFTTALTGAMQTYFHYTADTAW